MVLTFNSLIEENSLNSLEKISAFFDKEFFIKSEDDLSILKLPKNVSGSDLSAYQRAFKSMIFNNKTMNMVAPAVSIPIETEGDENLERAMMQIDDKGLQHIQSLHDGVMFRFYFHNDEWKFSTNGMITPTRGWNGNRSFQELMFDATDNFPFDKLDRSCCYYIILVHPEHHNVVKYCETELYLQDIYNLQTEKFLTLAQINNHLEQINGENGALFINALSTVDSELKELLNSDQMTKIVEIPVTPDRIGYLVTDNEGNKYRFESAHFQIAKKFRANQPDKRKIWVNLRNSQVDQEVYLAFYPDDAEVFTDMKTKFNALIKRFFQEYGNRFKLKQNVIHHSRHVKAINGLHAIYEQRRAEGLSNDKASITKDDIYKYLNQMEDRQVFYLINPDNVPPTYSYQTRKQVTQLTL